MSEIPSILQATMSPDRNARMQAELQLAELSRQPQTGPILAQIATSHDFDLPLRQSAAIGLRKFVGETWSSSSRSFSGHQAPIEVQENVRGMILLGLTDPSAKIRALCATVVSAIAKWDWPDQWPSLLPTLLNLLASPDGNCVHGAITVLSELIRRELSEDQILPLLQQLLPVLLSILGNVTVHSCHTRARAVNVFRECLRALEMVKIQHPKQVKLSVEGILPTWVDAFRQLLQIDPRPEVDKDYGGDLLVRLQIFMTLLTIHNAFPRHLTPVATVFLDICLTHLKLLYPDFRAEYILSTGTLMAAHGEFLDDDAVGTSPQLASPILDFVTSQLGVSKNKQWFEGGGVNEFVLTVVNWCQTTMDDDEAWTDDINLFINDESDEANTLNIRMAAYELVDTSFEHYPMHTATALTTAMQQAMQESSHQQQAGDELWWKPMEASLAVLSSQSCSEAMLRSFDDEVLPTDQILYIMRDIGPTLSSAIDVPFLQGRAFIFASRYHRIVADELARSYLAAILQVLEAPAVSPIAKICAVRAIYNFTSNPSLTLPFAEGITRVLAPLLNQSTEDTLIQILETLNSIVGLEDGKWMGGQLAGELAGHLLYVLDKNIKDVTFISMLTNMFERLAGSPHYASVVSATLPRLAEAIRMHAVDQSWYAISAIELANSLMTGCHGPGLGQGFVQVLVPPLFAALEITDDGEMIVNGVHALTLIVRKDCSQLLLYRDATGLSGLDHVVRILSKVLAPTDSEAGSLYVGDLIVHLIRVAGDALGPILPDMLVAMLNRLTTAKTATFIQSLVIPFAYLIHLQRDHMLNLLESTSVRLPSGELVSGLQVLVNAWCENTENFFGYWPIRISDLGLCQMFISQRPSLTAMTVRGDQIIRPETRNIIVTRSKAKQIPIEYTMIPFPVKAIKLIVKSFKSDREAGAGPTYINIPTGDDDDEDGEDWADEETIYQGVKDDNFGFLSDDLEDDDPPNSLDDEDLKEDPISKIDMQAHLLSFLRDCATHNINNFSQVMDHLTADEQLVIRRAVGGR